MKTYFETNPSPFIFADFDYFRLPRERWELLLIRLKQMGVNGLVVAVPWGFHEIEAGKIDLDGLTNSRRDLTGLLHLASVIGLPCLLNLGLRLSQGILGNGLPPWLKQDPADPSSDIFTAAIRWTKALNQTLVARQWPAGPIIAVQIDNDIAAGQSPPLSRDLTEVKWPIWLRKRYPSIEALNAAYGSSYRTVSRVPFPENWGQAVTPLDQDAKLFLEEMDAAVQTDLGYLLDKAGWQIPYYLAPDAVPPGAPALQSYSLTEGPILPHEPAEQIVLHLRQPIQAEPDPADIGAGPVWAAEAPIRVDGSLRRSFWRVRHALWQQRWPAGSLEEKLLTLAVGDALILSSERDVTLKLPTGARSKSPVHRLRMSGELVLDEGLQVARKKLGGVYLAEDETSQTDLILLLAGAAAAPPDFLAAYFQTLLRGQVEALGRSAALAGRLGDMLTLAEADSDGPAAEAGHPVSGSYILDEARRGLSEADAALRKALSSIGGLERGFATILTRDEPDQTGPAPGPVAITPAAFEGPARQALLAAGSECAKAAPKLKAAAAKVEKSIEQSAGLDLAAYQESYRIATGAARAVRQPLEDIIAHLRLGLASAQLPLVVWRVHDQVQAVAETLRWGVLRGHE